MKPQGKDPQLFRTSNLFVACAAEVAGHPIVALEGNFPNQVTFVFQSSRELARTIAEFHSGSLYLPAKKLLYGQKQLKDRLWEKGNRLL